MTEYSRLKVPSLGRVVLFLAVVILISGLTAPVKGLPSLRNELGAFAGTATLLLFIGWFFGRDGLTFKSLFSESRLGGAVNRMKRAVLYFVMYAGAFIACYYLIRGGIAILHLSFPGSTWTVQGFENWFSASASTRNLSMADRFGAAPVWNVFCAVFFAPFLEELFHRRIIYVAMRKRFNLLASVALSSILFGLLHAPVLLAVAGTTLNGLFLAALYEKQRDFAAVVAFHSLNNMFVLSIMWLRG